MNPGREHAMDGLRAIMMLLGVVLHASLSYSTLPLDFWPFRDARQNGALDVLCILIHTFRMPVFFCIAGYFSHALLQRRGWAGFAGNRWQRVVRPMMLTWALLYLPMATGAAYAAQPASGHSLHDAWKAALTFAPSAQPGLYHLWFLYYLTMIYAAMLLMRRLLGRERRLGILEGMLHLLRKAPRNLMACAAILAPPTALLMLPMPRGMIDTPESVVPEWSVLLVYGMFFTMGWLLQTERRLLDSMARQAWWCLPPAILVLLGSLVWMRKHMTPEMTLSLPNHAVTLIGTALSTWLLLFSVLGLGQRYLSRPSRFWRGMADASYTVYLLHFPVTMWLPMLIASWPLPALLKASMVFAATLAITLLAYRVSKLSMAASKAQPIPA